MVVVAWYVTLIIIIAEHSYDLLGLSKLHHCLRNCSLNNSISLNHDRMQRETIFTTTTRSLSCTLVLGMSIDQLDNILIDISSSILIWCIDGWIDWLISRIFSSGSEMRSSLCYCLKQLPSVLTNHHSFIRVANPFASNIIIVMIICGSKSNWTILRHVTWWTWSLNFATGSQSFLWLLPLLSCRESAF